jgi:hypothetical protein
MPRGDETTTRAVSTALAQRAGKVLPWKAFRDAVGGAPQAGFAELLDASSRWPCELHAAGTVRLGHCRLQASLSLAKSYPIPPGARPVSRPVPPLTHFAHRQRNHRP